ncbi:MAG: hypothetical protein U1E73_03095 [Planctomycetota bacterium]
MSEWGNELKAAAADGEHATFNIVMGTTGGADRLAIVYDDDRFDLVSSDELHDINFPNTIGGFRVRSPLVARLKETATGREFEFMVNHLYRSDSAKRREQGKKLHDWAAVQPVPVIAVGDYNFDWDLPMASGETHNDEMVRDGVWLWVRPSNPMPTQFSSHESILDFVFLSGPARSWQLRETLAGLEARSSISRPC